MPPLQGVTKHLLIINVLMYFGTIMLWGDPGVDVISGVESIDWRRYWLASFYPTSEFFRPWQIATHMFMHGNIQHLAFNMLSLYMFGTMVEMVWGAKRFLFFYLTCGLGAWLLHIGATAFELNKAGMEAAFQIENIPMLGASGAIFGVLAGYGLLFPNNVIQLLFPPIPMKAKYFVLIMGGLDLYLGISGTGTGVAHFAHVGGAIFGAALFFYWNKGRRNIGW